MRLMGLTSNIMSLGGIAIAIGAMVDAAIVVVEQTHKKLEEWERSGPQARTITRVVIDAVKEVGGPSFFALLVIAVAFLPVLTLEAQEGRLFKPLAYTKNFSMIVAAVLAITLDPAMRLLFTRMKNFEFRPRWLARVVNAVLVGKIHSEENHPISRILIRALRAGVRLVAALEMGGHRGRGGAGGPDRSRSISGWARSSCRRSTKARCSTCPPPLPGISVTEAQRLLQVQDRILTRFPEVERVLGKAGRAETSTDPAPLSMMETVIVLKPRSRVAQGRYLVFALGAGVDSSRSSATSRPTTSRPEELVDEMNAGAAAPRRLQRLDHAHQEPHRHADHRHPHARGHQDLRRGHQRHRADRARSIEAHAARRARHAQRLRRAHRRRLFPGLRPGTATSWPATA